MPYAVYGAIGERYKELGGAGSWLGQPISDEKPFTRDGGRVSNFENGNIFWWPDTGAIELADVALRYKGMYCFSTTSGPGADEPYVTFGVAPTPGMGPWSVRSPIYDDVDGGDSRPDAIELYRGRPYGVQLQCGLWEHDAGDADQVVGLFKGLADEAAKKGVEACEGRGGSDVAQVCQDAWDGSLRGIAGGLLDDLFGVEDDKIKTWAWTITPKDMVRLVRVAPTDWWGNIYHLESPLLSGEGADYKVYLDVVPV